MPRVIFKCPYVKGGAANSAAHLGNYVRYMATRDGAQRITPAKAQLPATKKQREIVEQLLREFPLSKALFEFEDYLTAPTCGNASEFITRALEDNYDLIAKRENYVDYIASRPRAQRTGTHALFSGTDDPLVLSQVADMVAHHPGNVWLPIISLHREDAARLGYDSAEQWRELLAGCAMQIAEAMNIPWEQFRWYAAFHDEAHHPHVHMVCYSEDGKSGYLTRNGIAQIKSELTRQIFRQELHELYGRQTQRRDELIQETADTLRQLTMRMQSGTLESACIEQLMSELARRLKTVTGKKQYGYLKAPLKSLVDEIVDELAKDSRVAQAYELWYELRENVLRGYKDKLPERLPLSQQKEFRQIKNIVIKEAALLGDHSAVFSPADMESAPKLPVDGGEQVESDPPPDDEPQSPVRWSDRYRNARRFLFGGDDCPQDHAQAYALFLEEALAGNALAMFDLGRMLADGLGCEIDADKSREWYTQALEVFHNAEEEQPDRFLEYRIGKMYAAGLGAEQDYAEAAKWLSHSAGKGYQYAQYSLAGLNYRGQGVEKSYETAHGLYTASAAQGFPYAAYELGKMCRDGLGCEKDEARSAAHFSRAYAGFRVLEQQSHDDKVQYRIGWMLLHGVGTEKDDQAARRWFEKAAELGNPQAQYSLAKLILADPGSDPEQIDKAVAWLTRAAKTGQDSAQYALGKLYRDGTGVKKDPRKAAEWFERSAGQDNDYAAYALGRLLLDDVDGLPRNVSAAVKWLTRSAELGNQYAQYCLGKLLLQGEEVPKDVAEAVRLFTASAEQGNPYAQYALGKLYLLGKEVPVDKEAAARWFTLSAAQGNEYAQYFVDHMNDPHSPSLVSCATRLLYHMSRIFREQTPHPARGIHVTDRKLRQKIREKKIAMGHKPDDHEPEMTQ